VRAPERRRVVVGATVLVLALLAGCGSGEDPPVPEGTATPGPTASTSPAPSATPAATPADGVTLASLGFLNGPVRQLTLPRTALLSAAVDQTNNVTAVLAQPPPPDVADYLRRTLPATGFTITADDPDGSALTFTGHGWTGSFTASDTTSAVLLRPS
jgi:hypothetical protein